MKRVKVDIVDHILFNIQNLDDKKIKYLLSLYKISSTSEKVNSNKYDLIISKDIEFNLIFVIPTKTTMLAFMG